MADTARLNTTFQRFASFGTGSNQQGPITIDNAHFAKVIYRQFSLYLIDSHYF